jgi:hypothetical protein
LFCFVFLLWFSLSNEYLLHSFSLSLLPLLSKINHIQQQVSQTYKIKHKQIQIGFVCGFDLFSTMADPTIWREDHVMNGGNDEESDE